MVSRFVNIFQSKVEGLHDAAYLLAVATFASHFLALARDRLLAHTFGASTTLDVYYAAFRIPDFIFVSVASMVSLFVLIPIIIDKEESGRTRAFLSNVFSGFLLFIVLLSLLAFAVTPWIVERVFPGLATGGTLETLVLLTRIMLLSPIFLGISNILTSVTQTSKRFFIYALSPILYNVGSIVGVIGLYPLFGLPGLAYGVVIGALLHLLVQVPTVRKLGLLPKLVLNIDYKELGRVALTSLPRTFTLAVNQIMMLVLVALASLMAAGSITVFNFGFNLQGVPLSIIGISYSVAAFPTLARLFSRKEHQKFLDQMVVAVRHIVFWTIPALVLFIVLRAQIVRVVLGSGAFDWADTRLTAAVLALFVVSLASQSLELLFIRGYYAAGRTIKPLTIKVLSLGITVLAAIVGVKMFEAVPAFRYFLESLLRIEGISGTTVIVLPMAYSLGLIVSSFALWILFRRDFGAGVLKTLRTSIWHSFSSSVVAGAVIYGTLVMLGGVLNLNTFLGIFTQGLVAGLVGIIVAVLMLKLYKSKELEEVLATMSHRFWRTQTVIPDPEEL